MTTNVHSDVIVRLSHTRNRSLLGLVFFSPSVSLSFLSFSRFNIEDLQAAKDVSASHEMLLDLFERMEDFFKRFKVYSRSLLNTELAGTLVKVVVKVLNILSLATKEVEQSRASESILHFQWTCSTSLINYLERYIKRLAGKKDIENAVGELENLIQGEHYTVTAQVLQDTMELRRGAYPHQSGPFIAELCPPRCGDNRRGCTTDSKQGRRRRASVMPYRYFLL